MSGFADALARAQSLAPLADSLNAISQQIQQDRARRNFFNAMDAAHSQINNIYNPQPQPNLNLRIPPTPTLGNIRNSTLGQLIAPQNRTLGNLMPQQGQPQQPQQTNMQNAVQPNNQIPEQAPDLITPEDITAITNPGVDINAANKKAEDLLYNTIMQMVKDKVPSDLLNYGQGALQSLITKNQPPRNTWKSQADGSELVEFDSFGNPTGNIIKNPRNYNGVKTSTVTENDGTPKVVKKDNKYYNIIKHTYPDNTTSEEYKPIPNAAKVTVNTGNNNKNIADSSDVISGIAAIKSFKNSSREYSVDELNRMGFKDANGQPFTKPQTLMVNPKTNLLEPASQTEINSYKEEIKNKYRKSAIAEAQRLGVYPGIKRIQQSINNGMDHDKAVQLFLQNNPNLDENSVDAIKNYFELDKL